MGVSSRLRMRFAFGASLLIALAGAGPVRGATPQTYVVDTAADTGGSVCTSPCSLRQAINAANVNVLAHDTIVFAIPGGPADLPVGAALPAITDAVTIDGTSQPGTRVLGASAGTGTHGFHVQASGTVIRGLEVREFDGNAIHLDGVADTIVGGDTVADGNVLRDNGGDGIALVGGPSAVGNGFTANRIYANGGLAVDVDDDGFADVGGPVGDLILGPNAYQHAPVIAGPLVGPVTSVVVSAAARPSVGAARVEVFWSSACLPGELLNTTRVWAEEYLGSVDIPLTSALGGSSGTASFDLPAPRMSGYLSAMTTTADGTSEMPTCVRIEPPTDLEVVGSSTPAGLVDIGDPLTFDVQVSNLGPVDHDAVVVALGLDGGDGTIQALTSSQGSCDPFGVAAICNIGALAVGGSATISLVLVPTVAGPFNLVSLTFGDTGADPNPGNNIATLPITVAAVEDVTGAPIAGGSVTTDGEADGATPADPFETTVTVPAGGSVSIGERTVDDPPPAGYQFFGQAAVIDVDIDPPATAPQPIVLRFLLDGSLVPAEPLLAFRNGVLVAPCTVADPLKDPSATPDPCVLPPEMIGDDLQVTVRTSAASTWQLGFALPYAFDGFFAPIDNGGVANRVKAGAAVPVKFSLGGDRGLDIFAAGNPRSIGVACGSADIDPVEQTVSAGSSTLVYDPASDRYTYVWKTAKDWAGSCRQLTIEFADGTTETALFSFTR